MVTVSGNHGCRNVNPITLINYLSLSIKSTTGLHYPEMQIRNLMKWSDRKNAGNLTTHEPCTIAHTQCVQDVVQVVKK